MIPNKRFSTAIMLLLISCSMSSLFGQHTLNNGLIAHYPFDGTPEDVIAGNDAVLFNGIVPTADRFGCSNGAYYFDGIDQRMEVAHSPVFDHHPLSVSVWFQKENATTDYLPTGGTHYSEMILWKGNNGGGPRQNSFDLMIENSSAPFDVFFRTNFGTSPSRARELSVIQPQQWYNVIAISEGTTLKLYLNGVLVDVVSSISDINPVISPLFIGAFPDGFGGFTAQRHFQGSIDDLRIYDRALTPSEIQEMQNLTPGPCTAPGSCTDVYLDFKNAENGSNYLTNSTIKPIFRLTNNGSTPVPLSHITMRYWYTEEVPAASSVSCLTADIGCGVVNGQYNPVSPGLTGADAYLEVGFSSGSLAPGDRINVKMKILSLSSTTSFNEADDYSFAGLTPDHIYNPNITLYCNGVLIQGTEPAAVSPGLSNVLLIGADWSTSTYPFVQDVKQKIEATGLFSQIDWVDVSSNPWSSPLSGPILEQYDAVLVWSSKQYHDPATLRSLLIGYMDAGNGVVQMQRDFSGVSDDILDSSQYQIGSGYSYNPPYVTLGTYDATHVIMQGVNSVDTWHYSSNRVPNAGTQLVASWTNGVPAVYVKENLGPNGAKKADLNMWPVSTDEHVHGWATNTDCARLMANALLWVQADNAGTNGASPLKQAAATLQSSTVIAYPNPFARGFTVELPEAPATSVEFRLLDMRGKELYRHVSQSRISKLGPENLNSGIYLLQVIQGTDSHIIRVIKQ